MKSSPPQGTRLAFAIVVLLTFPLVALPVGAGCRVMQWTSLTSAYGFYYGTNGLFVADLNGDGYLDVVGGDTRAFQTAFGTGAGYFSTGRSILSGSSSSSLRDLQVADFTGDGLLDVAAPDYALGRILLFRGSATGSFADIPVVTATTTLPNQIAAGDFDEDGHLDLVFTSWESNAVTLLRGDGTGQFTEAGRMTVPTAQVTKIVSGDFDADGHKDLAFAHKLSSAVDVLFGQGEGTFSGATQAMAGTYPDSSIGMIDIDSDGDADLIAANGSDQTVTVARNLGGRLFAAPQAAPIDGGGTYSALYQRNFATADFNGDGKLDVATLVNSPTKTMFAVLNGRGDGTFDDATFSRGSTTPGSIFVAADADGDGRPDLLALGSGSLIVHKNACGDSTLTATTAYPLISVGQVATITATISPAGATAPPVTGTIQFSEGSNVLGSVIVSDSKAVLDLPGLTAGDHTITAHYSGDENYSVRTVSSLQRVTTASTTTTLTFPQSPEYGQNVSVTVKVVSSAGGTPPGTVSFYVDGVLRGSQGTTYPNWSVLIADIGVQHTFKATYSGDSTYPPGAAERTFISAKASGGIVLSGLPSQSIVGSQLSIGVVVGSNNTAAQPPTGMVRVFVDGGMVAEVPADNAYPYPQFTISLPIGAHYFSAEYGGDDHFAPGHLTPTPTFLHRVLASNELRLDARADTDGKVTLLIAGTSYYRVTRRTAGSAVWSGVSYDGDPVERGVMYLYRLESLEWGTAKVIGTTFDVAMVPDFAEWPILRGMAVKAAHFTEIVARTNLIRSIAGLPPVTAPPSISSGQTILATDIQQVRAWLEESRAAVGCRPVPYSVPAFAPGTAIVAADMAEMQEATR